MPNLSFMMVETEYLCFSHGLLSGDDRNVASVLCTLLEADHAIYESVERMVAAHTHVLTGMMYSASLANDDVAGFASLSTPNLHAQSLAG